jgi:hypothetical protein
VELVDGAGQAVALGELGGEGGDGAGVLSVIGGAPVCRWGAAGAAGVLAAPEPTEDADPFELTQDLLDAVADEVRAAVDDSGEPFALATAGLAGDELTVGDADTTFPTQSISKVFALTLALRVAGEDLFERAAGSPPGTRTTNLDLSPYR